MDNKKTTCPFMHFQEAFCEKCALGVEVDGIWMCCFRKAGEDAAHYLGRLASREKEEKIWESLS